jgi:hypothetical protein
MRSPLQADVDLTRGEGDPLSSNVAQRENEGASAIAGERSELLARKHGGRRLSPGEEERLQRLTSRLEELLPPVSRSELESLLDMAEEVESIRERARERRRQLVLS